MPGGRDQHVVLVDLRLAARRRRRAACRGRGSGRGCGCGAGCCGSPPGCPSLRPLAVAALAAALAAAWSALAALRAGLAALRAALARPALAAALAWLGSGCPGSRPLALAALRWSGLAARLRRRRAGRGRAVPGRCGPAALLSLLAWGSGRRLTVLPFWPSEAGRPRTGLFWSSLGSRVRRSLSRLLLACAAGGRLVRVTGRLGVGWGLRRGGLRRRGAPASGGRGWTSTLVRWRTPRRCG